MKKDTCKIDMGANLQCEVELPGEEQLIHLYFETDYMSIEILKRSAIEIPCQRPNYQSY